MTEIMNQLGNLEMKIFGFGKKKKEEDLNEIKQATEPMFDRRTFIKRGVQGGTILASAGVVGKVGSVIAKASDFANVGSGGKSNTIFGSGRDPLPTILSSLIENPLGTKIPGIPPGIHLAGKLYERAWVVRDKPEELVKFIKEFDYKNEPASYLIAGYIYENPWEIATSKERWAGQLYENDAMTHFAEEIGLYLNKYLRFQEILISEIETSGQTAMQIASNQTIDDLFQGKLNLNNISPRNLKILVWATTWLVNSYMYEKKDYKTPYKQIELPIISKHNNLRVRRNKGDKVNVFYDNDGGIIV